MVRRDRFEQTMTILSKLNERPYPLSKLIEATNTSHDMITPKLLKLKKAGAIKEEATPHLRHKKEYHITPWGIGILKLHLEIIEKMKGIDSVPKEEKHKLGEYYFIPILKERFHLTFRNDKDVSGEHTHIYLEKNAEKGIGMETNEAFKIFYIFRYMKEPPIDKLTDVALLLGFSYEKKEDWNKISIEFLLYRKLDQDLINDMGNWVENTLIDMDEITIVDEVTGEVLAE